MSKKNSHKTEGDSSGGGISGFLGGLTEMIEKLGDLAEKTQEISRQREISDPNLGDQLKGIIGFNVKIGGLGEEKLKVQPFGNIKRDEKSGETVVQEIREPMVDMFEEDDHLLIVAEMPGIGSDNVTLDIKDDVLTIRADRREKKYGKEVLLPRSYPREKIEFSCNNGMLEIKCFE